MLFESTSTASRRSTTPSGTPTATSCSARSPPRLPVVRAQCRHAGAPGRRRVRGSPAARAGREQVETGGRARCVTRSTAASPRVARRSTSRPASAWHWHRTTVRRRRPSGRADLAMYSAKDRKAGAVFFERARLRQHAFAPDRPRRSAVARWKPAISCRSTFSRSTRSMTSVSSGSKPCCAGSIPSAATSRPAEFIEMAEGTGIILQLTEHVLDEALAQTRRWLRRRPPGSGRGQSVDALPARRSVPRARRTPSRRTRRAGRAAAARGHRERRDG